VKRLRDYLGHIAEAIRRIETYTAGLDEPRFRADQMVQDAVLRNIEIIGEASRNISRAYPDFAAQNPQLELETAYKMRNAASHGYFSVDVGIVWSTISVDLPKLLADVEAAMATISPSNI